MRSRSKRLMKHSGRQGRLHPNQIGERCKILGEGYQIPHLLKISSSARILLVMKLRAFNWYPDRDLHGPNETQMRVARSRFDRIP